MRDDQTVRLAGMAAAVLAYIGHLLLNQTADLALGPYPVSGFVVVSFVVLTLALPEALEYIPLGPTRGDG